jgi:tetratricopeptide (TPR) repeat protein
MHLKHLVEARRFREAVECYHSWESPTARRAPRHQLLAADAAARLGELSLSQQLATSAFHQFAGTGEQPGLMQASNLLGAIAFERGQVIHARGYFAKTIELARRHGDRPMLARVSNNLGTLSHLSGDSESAIPLYQEAGRLFHTLHDGRGEAEAYHNLGLCLRQLGRLEEAAAAAADAVRLADDAHVRSLQALTVLGQAEIAVEQGYFDAAGKLIVRGAAIAGEAGDQFNGLEAGRLRALVTLRQGDFAVAHHLAEVAASIAGNLGSALLRAECTALSALALRCQGRTKDAIVRQEEALAGFEDLGARVMIDRFRQDWGRASGGTAAIQPLSKAPE